MVDDTSRTLESIYSKFYLPEIIKNEMFVSKTVNRNDEDIQEKINKRLKEVMSNPALPTMNVEFCIRGIGNHD